MKDILRACVAYHEAGHAVYYFLHRFGVDFCSIDAAIVKERFGIDAAGGTNRMRPSMDATPKGLRIELDGHLSGTTAERIFLASHDATQFPEEIQQRLIQSVKKGAKKDCENFNAVLELPAFRHLTDAEKQEHRAASPVRARSFVFAHVKQIDTLAAALYERGTIYEADISTILAPLI